MSKLVVARSHRGATDPIGLHNIAGDPINPATCEKQQSLIDIAQFPGISFRASLENGGSADMAVDGSSTPVDFSIAPPSGKIWYVHNVTVVIQDVGITFLKFGGIAPPLTNGLDFKFKQNGLAEVTIANIKNNGEFYTFANRIFLESAGTDLLVAHMDVKTNTGSTVKLVDSNSDYIRATVNDNLTALNKFQIIVRGYEVDE